MVRDYEVAHYLRKSCGGGGEIIAPTNSLELLSVINRYNFVVATRMHAAIGAACLGVPFVALAWQDKFKYCFKEVQLEHRICSLNEKDALEKFESIMKIEKYSPVMSLNQYLNDIERLLS
ncbi:polysaccharide pyruvyl transferase family protein [Neptunomonas japonica]|uniref:polysaccharide pyruvyl transferase family protein n=1 Tax=Neptunomonas japonica TaxID=417574 RepID=UPI002E2FEE8E|nr:polysaccharide pyruvyl transferase family protein [Neptunomonas japonica]